jgi:hypothetical protein
MLVSSKCPLPFKFSDQIVMYISSQSVQRWATGWTIGVLGFDSRRGLGIFPFITASKTALGPTQPPDQWKTGALSLGVKLPGREADHSPPSCAEVKDAWSYISTPQYVFTAWCLVKYRDNFTFTSPIRVTCPIHFIVLDLITLIIFGDVYKI